MERARWKRKKPTAGSSIILREQIQLLKAEKELLEALKKIGQYKNRLIVGILVTCLQYSLHIFNKSRILLPFQVEELELKANLARNVKKPIPTIVPEDIFKNYDNPEIINKKEIDIRIKNQDEEFDSD